MKQNSIEFLFEKLWDTPKDKFEWNAILKQAKAMHKEEIEMAYINGQQVNSKSLTSLMMMENSESYYNETFGGKNE